MYKNIVAATDGSEIAMAAFQHAVEVAKSGGAKLTAVTVSEPYEAIAFSGDQSMYQPNEYNRHKEAHAAQILDQAVAAAKAQDVACETIHSTNRYAYDGIIHTAEELGADLIVVGSHGRRGIEGLLLGSQAIKLLTHTKIPVLVVR